MVSGGLGPYQYDWFKEYCYADSGWCSDLYQTNSGIGLSSISVEYPGEMIKIRIVVHVYDAQSVPFAGAVERTTTNITGPQTYIAANGLCEAPSTFYPVRDFDGKHYRRNGCTGIREYDPSGN
jgi:hypothetical protein